MSVQPMRAMGHQKGVATAIPYSQQISPNTVITYEGDLTETIQLQGIPFETMGNTDLDGRNDNWFANVTSIAKDDGVALWTHIVRRKISYDMSSVEYDNHFSTEFAKAYGKKFAAEPQYYNELFISPVIRMGASGIDRWGMKLSKKDSEEMETLRDQARERMNQVASKLSNDLRAYHPKRLGTYDQEGVTCTETGGFYSRLLNGRSKHVPLRHAELAYEIQSTGLEFGGEVVEIVGASGSRYAALLGLVAPYTVENIDCKVFEGLLGASFEFVLSQSVTVMPFNKADGLLKKQINTIKSTSNNKDQIDNLETARKNLQNGKFSMFDHEFILVLYGDSIKELNTNINQAQSVLDAKVIGTSRIKGGAMISAYFSMLPGNFKFGRPRAMPISSENFVKFFPMHNYSIGNALGSQWGMPIAVLKNQGSGPYFFNYHVSRSALLEQGVNLEYEEAEEGEHRKEVGHYRVLGQTGGGKTVVKMALRALARKKNVVGKGPLKTYSFDLHRGEEIPIRAMGGKYHRFENGSYTGLAVFKSLPDNPDSHNLIFRVASWCAQQGGMFHMTPNDEQILFKAIRMVYTLPHQHRRFARLLDNIPDTGNQGLKAVLMRWVEDGPFAWVMDSNENAFDLTTANNWGFDITSFIDIEEARQPILMALTHQMSLASEGSPHIIDIAEAWKSLKDPMMRAFIEDKALTLRRKDGIIGLDTQEPEHLTESGLGSTLVTQFPTQILLPNSSADPEAYIDGLRVTPREFDIIKNTPQGQGYFLVKKGKESTLARMDLSGMNDWLAVLSTSQDNLDILDDIRSQLGDDPAVWLPEFFKRRK